MRRIGTVLLWCVLLGFGWNLNGAWAFNKKPQLPSSLESNASSKRTVSVHATEDTKTRTAHTKRWTTDNPDSKKSLSQKSSYTEIHPGLHVLATDSQFKSADPTLISTPEGAAAKQLNHPIRFASHLSYGRPTVEQGDRNNPVLQASPALIVYRDLSSDRSVVLARSKPASLTFENNIATYKDAFDHLRADVRYTVRAGNLEQDVLLYEKPLKPSAYGLNDDSTVLAVMTRVFSLENRLQSGYSLQSPSTHQTLAHTPSDLKTLMTPHIAGPIVLEQDGKAIQQFARSYVLSKNSKQPVHKRLVTVQGIHFLAEEIPATYFQKQDLPIAKGPKVSKHTPFTQLEVLANANFAPENKDRLAEVRPTLISAPVIIDFISVTSTTTDFTFEQGETYLVSGTVTMTGVTTFEGGTTIKFDSTGSLDVSDPVFNTTSSNWAVFTSKNDDSVGEVIVGSTGSPSSYPNALTLSKGSVRYVQIRYADEGIGFSGNDTLTVRDSEFFAVGTPVNASSNTGLATLNLNNVLIVQGTSGPVLADDGVNALTVTANNVTMAYLTGEGFSNTTTATGSSLSITDSLFVDIQGTSVFAGTAPATEDYNAFFQTPGTGSGANNIALAADPILTDFFLDQSSPVINGGSQSASSAGLYHYTTDTAGAIEANSQADIGYHFPPDALAFSLLARDSLIVRQQVIVHSGNLGVNNPAPRSKPVLKIFQQTETEEVSIFGDRVFIEEQAVIQGDVLYNHLTGTGTINGTQTTPLALPLVGLPVLKPASLQGNEPDVFVPEQQQQTLAPGKYGTVTVSQQSTLTFTGGLYEMESFVVDQQDQIFFETPTELRIKKKLAVGQEDYFGPASGSDLSASDIIIHVEGSGVSGHHVNIGQTGIFFGNVLASNGTFRLDQQNKFFGQVTAKDIIIEQQNEITLQAGQGGGNTVSAPIIMPPGGSFFDFVEVDIFTITSGATIHFTTDGSTPTTASPVFTAPFTLTISPTPITVKAIAVRDGFVDSAVSSAEFTVQAQPVAQVAISPASGTFQGFVFITMSTETEGAQIFYTLDGSEPTSDSILYQFSFSLTESTTVRAVAVKEGFVNSPIVGASYIIEGSPPIATSNLSGRILDTNSLVDQGVEIPVVGVTVSLLGTGISTVSDANGSFTLLNVPLGSQIFDLDTSTANLAPDGSTYAGFREEIEIAPGLNVVDRPFFLPRIDASSLTTIDPAVDTEVTNSNLETSLMVVAGSAKNEDGTDFTGQMSISNVPNALAPAALPDFLEPGLLITIQPVGVTFNQPLPISFPNIDDLVPGSEMDIWSLDPATGEFIIVGVGQVSADGSVVNTISGGIRAATWHGPAPPQPDPDDSDDSNDENDGDDDNCTTCPAGSATALHSGNLSEDHRLVSYRSFGQERALTFRYNSIAADPQPIVATDTTILRRGGVPRSLSARLEVGGVDQGIEVFTSTTNPAPLSESRNETVRQAIQFDASGLETGSYPYRLNTTNNYSRTRISSASTGTVLVNNRINSPFGAGWTLKGLQRIHPQADGNVVLTKGNGGIQRYEPISQVYQNDFEGAVGPEWSNNQTDITPTGGRRFLGQFGSGNVNLTLGDLPPHSDVTISFDLFIIRSWDGNNTTAGPDQWSFGVTGEPALLETTFSFADTPVFPNFRQAFPDMFPGGDNPGGTGAIEVNTLGYTFSSLGPADLVYRLTFTVPHTGSSIGFDFSALLRGVADESWGLDNVGVSMTPVATEEIVASRFDTGTDGWTVIGDGTALTFNATGGNPGGHISASDLREGATWRWLAPAKFLGDQSEAYDGRLGFDLLQSSVSNPFFDPNDVSLTGGGLSLTLDTPNDPGEDTNWTRYSVLLREDGGWVLAGTNQAPTRAQMETVLADLTAITIRGEFRVGADTGRLDNVVLSRVSRGEPVADIFRTPAADFSTLIRNDNGTFTRTMKDGTQFEFDTEGRQTAVVDRNDLATRYLYDTQGLLTKVIGPTNKQSDPACPAVDVPAQGVTCLLYTAGKLSSIIDPAGRETRFEVDTNGDLISITDPDDSVRRFAYDARHRLKTQVSKRGFPTTYDYGFHGRNIQSNRSDQSTNKFGISKVFGLADLASGIGTADNPAPYVRPEDRVATYTDGNGNVTTSRLNRFGGGNETADAMGRVTTTARDSDNLETQIVSPTDADPSGEVITQLEYDQQGNLLALREAPDTAFERLTTFTFTADFNQIKMVTDRNQNTLPEVERKEISFDYDSKGNLTDIFDKAGTRTHQVFADLNCPGLATRITEALDLPEEATIIFTYDPVNCNLVETRDPLQTLDPLRNSTVFAYDSAGNVIEVTDALLRSTRFVYDKMNRVIKEIDATNSEADPLCGTPGVTCREYDETGNLIALTDGNNNITRFGYDTLDRLGSRNDPDPTLSAKTFEYDGNGNLRFTTDRKSQTIEFRYDAVDRLVAKVMLPDMPEETVRTFGYDKADNLTTITDPDSTLTFTYDLFNRLETTSTAGTFFQPEVEIAYTYDANSNRKAMAGLTGLIDTNYDYDELDRLTALTDPANQAIGPSITFSYDALSRRTSKTLPNGTATAVTYDAASNLKSITHALGATTLSRFAYIYNTINNRDTLSQIRSTLSVASPLNYSYDEKNQLTGATHPLPGQPSESFGYDPLGNRLLTGSQTTDSVIGVSNRLLEDARFCYSYGANGNLETKTAKVGGLCTAIDTTTIYIYDAENRLVGIDFPGGGFAAYRYDGQNRRIEKNVNGVITRYVYDKEDILLEYDGSNVLQARYIHGPGIDEPLIMDRDLDANNVFDAFERFIYHIDGLGSVTELTNSNGAIVTATVYDSFGQIAAQTGTLANSYAYTGREFDSESGLYYYRARYYDPESGRFLSEDLLGFSAEDLNLYRYVGNNPINFIDPNGFAKCPPKGHDNPDRWLEDWCRKTAYAAIVCLELMANEPGPRPPLFDPPRQEETDTTKQQQEQGQGKDEKTRRREEKEGNKPPPPRKEPKPPKAKPQVPKSGPTRFPGRGFFFPRGKG